jgi:hypothetical protein
LITNCTKLNLSNNVIKKARLYLEFESVESIKSFTSLKIKCNSRNLSTPIDQIMELKYYILKSVLDEEKSNEIEKLTRNVVLTFL